MKFPYRRFGGVARPVITLRLKWHSRSVRYDVLIDSGADECMFDAAVAEFLGINLEQGEMRKATGVGGQMVVYFMHPVDIEIGGRMHTIDAGFISRPGGPFEYGAVGQKGFFDKFIVTFDYLKQEIELKTRS